MVNDANAEVRRVTLTNRGNRLRTLDVTSYAEVALNPRRADQAHPAFAKLFLETEHLLPDRLCYAAAGRGPATNSRFGPCTCWPAPRKFDAFR